ncbi:MAG: hypothetical protein V2A72_05015 [Candidatus Omnitrophota bacterium]
MKWISKINIREKMLTLVVCALVFLWITYSLIIEPISSAWVRLNKNIEIEKIQLKKGVKILTQKKALDDKYGKYMQKFLARESDEEEMALILNEIERLAGSSLVRIVNMKPRRTEKDGPYRTFYIDLDTEAAMPSILQFIKQLKDSKFCLRVEQFTLNSRTNDPSVLTGALTISRFALSKSE